MIEHAHGLQVYVYSVQPKDAPARDNCPVSREQARAVAEEYLRRADVELEGKRIGAVYALDEIRWRRPCIYGMDRHLATCWIAYVHRLALALRSSTIVLVSKVTGEVIYAGSANDEG